MLMSLFRGGVSLTDAIPYILSALAVIFLTLPIHEFAHGFAASKLGDPTPRYEGRLTLNPFAHIDYIGALCILLFGFGWAKPVGINARYFKNPKRDMAISALAGPVSNIIVAFISFIIFNVIRTVLVVTGQFDMGFFQSLLLYFFYYVAQINVYLAVFNLIPIPPLDGSRILFAFLPTKYYFKFMQYERYIMIGIFALLFFGILDVPLTFLSNGVMTFLQKVAFLPFKAILGG